MEKKKLYYVKETAPMGFYKFIRVVLVIGAVFSTGAAVLNFFNGELIDGIFYTAEALFLFVAAIGLFNYKWYGPIVLFCLWLIQIGLYVADLIMDGDLLGKDLTTNVCFIVGTLVMLAITWLYFRKRRPIFQPYGKPIPQEELDAASYAVAQANQPLKQTNPYSSGQQAWQSQPQPAQAQQAPAYPGRPVQPGAETHRELGSHVAKLQQAYSHFNPSTVKILFPGGISQADNAVISIGNLLNVDLSSCGYETYFKLLKTYADFAIAGVSKVKQNEVIRTVREKNLETLRSDADAQVVESYYALSHDNPSFAVVDMASMTQVKSRMLAVYGMGGSDTITQPAYQPAAPAQPAPAPAAFTAPVTGYAPQPAPAAFTAPVTGYAPQPAPAPAAFAAPVAEPVPQPEPAPAEPAQAPADSVWTAPVQTAFPGPEAPADSVWTTPAQTAFPEPEAPAPAEPELKVPELTQPDALAEDAPALEEPVLAVPEILPEVVLEATAPELKVPEMAEPVLAESAGFCTNCGAPLKQGALFCTNCGKRL